MLTHDPWEKVAKFAAYCVQGDSLNLLPWEDPPCLGDMPPADCDPKAKKLLQKMRAHGVSKYHPDPMAAIAEAKPIGAA